MIRKVIKTITAYRCRICKLYHNDDLLKTEEDNEIAIDINILLREYLEYIRSARIDNNTRRTIMITEPPVYSEKNGIKKVQINSEAGRSGDNFTVLNHPTQEKTIYNGEENSALYSHVTFCFTKGSENVFVFFRFGKSGCKTAFENTFNKFLSTKKLKTHFDVLLSSKIMDGNTCSPKTVHLITTYIPTGSDIADNLNASKRKKIESELMINLTAPSAKNIVQWFREKIGRKPSNEELKSVLIKTNYGNTNFDEAMLTVKIGGSTRKISLQDFTGIMAEYDITDKLQYIGDSEKYTNESLNLVVDEYAYSFFDER